MRPECDVHPVVSVNAYQIRVLDIDASGTSPLSAHLARSPDEEGRYSRLRMTVAGFERGRGASACARLDRPHIARRVSRVHQIDLRGVVSERNAAYRSGVVPAWVKSKTHMCQAKKDRWGRMQRQKANLRTRHPQLRR